jgi:hypothetical protein
MSLINSDFIQNLISLSLPFFFFFYFPQIFLFITPKFPPPSYSLSLIFSKEVTSKIVYIILFSKEVTSKIVNRAAIVDYSYICFEPIINLTHQIYNLIYKNKI